MAEGDGPRPDRPINSAVLISSSRRIGRVARIFPLAVRNRILIQSIAHHRPISRVADLIGQQRQSSATNCAGKYQSLSE